MLRIREAIVVEGRYDKNTLSQLVDTVIIETSGFGIFKDKERLALLRRLAEKRGLIVLTDPDGAGFVIRSHLRGSLPPDRVKHAYVPDIYGKERRKRQGGKEGKLGVEGMRPQVLEAALRRAGATFLDEGGGAGRPGRTSYHQGGFCRSGPVRRPRGGGQAAGPAPAAGAARTPVPQRHAGGAQRPVHPRGAGRPVAGPVKRIPLKIFLPKFQKGLDEEVKLCYLIIRNNNYY